MVKKLIMISIASTLIAIGINVFIIPFHLLNGGVFGISLLLKYLLGFKLGLTIFCINFPIYLIAFKFDQTYFFNAIIGLVISTIIIDLLLPLSGIIQLPVLLSAAVGGLFIGCGVGIMLRNHTSPGGVDLLSLLMAKWFSINPGVFILLVDALIIVSGLVILKDMHLMYSLLTVTVVGIVVSIFTSFKSISINI
ncbi:YitT family protein [Bacillus sp. FJAT-49736]|uniref:YitT family protein n=1 Tax=Bacillus sp. FJAT-49736 TaxID=2833582 RepID=UPI001BC92D19|nr:YitT family protein [Bacillus sp. FJAT-49736]MBS4173075.1 YitT family protein [Bacillus sp. FJAT-49736]